MGHISFRNNAGNVMKGNARHAIITTENRYQMLVENKTLSGNFSAAPQ
jgi:hypothetical protein